MRGNYHIDNIDLKILNILSSNAKLPYTEVAKKVFVSGGTVHVRMRKLEKMGIVRGTKLDIDYSKLGYFDTQNGFVEINGEFPCARNPHFASLM